MRSSEEQLTWIAGRIAAHARADLSTPIANVFLSRVTTPDVSPDYSLTEPLLVLMAQAGKRLYLGDQVHEYRAGQCLVVTAELPVTGHYIDVAPGCPSLSVGIALRAQVVADLQRRLPVRRNRHPGGAPAAIATMTADDDLLDAIARLLVLLDRPSDAEVLAPLVEQEIVWRLLTGPLGESVRQIGLGDSDVVHIGRAITWIRDHYAEPMRVEELARVAGMSASTLHRRFRTVTTLSPLQFQKRIRLQHARTMLLARPGDVAGVGHAVGYDSPSQFSREYRRCYGEPPTRHSAQQRGGH